MCKEDVRIKRQTGWRTVTAANGVDSTTPILPPNPSRCTLIVSMVGDQDPTKTYNVFLRTGVNNTDPILISLTYPRPCGVITLEEYGLPMTLPIFATISAGNNVVLSVTEVFFLKSLEDL